MYVDSSTKKEELMEEYLSILEKCALFSGIRISDLSTLLNCLGAKIVNFEKKETILTEGEPAHSIGILLSGSAQMIQIDYFGNRSLVASVEPSDLFGESFACANAPAFPNDVVAKEKTCVMFLDCKKITQACCNACQFHQQIIYNLMKVIAEKNILLHQKIEITSKRSTREKLLAYLMIQAKKHQSNHFTIPFDRQELADYLLVDRSGLSAEISKLRKEGVFLCRKNEFTLLELKTDSSH